MDLKDIYEKLKVDFEFKVGARFQGLISSLGMAVASRFAEFLDKLDYLRRQAFIATADKDYLYLHTGKLLPPYPAETAKGYVVFYGDTDAIVPKGTELKDDNNTYTTLAEAYISKVELNGTIAIVDNIAVTTITAHGLTNCKGIVNGIEKDITVVDSNTLRFDALGLTDGSNVIIEVNKTGGVSVICNESGAGGNRELNDKLETKITIFGVNKEVGVLVISGGKDEEDTEDYRARVQDFIRNPQAPFNNNNIRFVNLNQVKTLKYVWVRNPIDGEVQVVALNKNFSLTQEEKDEILAITNAIAPAQMKDADAISVIMPEVRYIDVIIKNLSPTSDGLKEEVRKNIEYLFDKDLYEKGVSRYQIEAVVYKTTNGVEEVESFEYVSGECLATPNVFWKLRDVIFQ